MELAAIEGYERSHENRAGVLAKLRWLRGSEPPQGYDAMSGEEIAAELPNVDLETVERVRCYERKFQGRPSVLEEVADVIWQRKQSPFWCPT